MPILKSVTETIKNEFQYYNDKGFFPELRPFGTAVDGQPFYEFDLYIKGLDRSICLRRGAPSKAESRQLALKRLAVLTDLVMLYESYIIKNEFWEGFDYISDYHTVQKANPVFKTGMELRKNIKNVTEKHYKV